ncbi:PAS domain S-box protein [Botrimarina hoheduenensis]|uniref:Serine/threonine-protein kinase PknB n=1 Tax=Botrimarina hoheduenensis TaxID=2528000 RepID=A0A5C5W762_9BACT|nr:PAS domain S-box protein [Botrimarina hoheduenensis]TWT46736.1 Serine/threonine-protein kinase PknB [Botrimarina hoheduenensis]
MFDNEHPNDEILATWAAGGLDEALAGPIEDHLEKCDLCAARIERFALAEDAFVKKLQRLTLSEPLDPEANRVAAHQAPGVGSDLSANDLAVGVLALQMGHITRDQFVDASVLWNARNGVSLAEVLVAQGWLDQAAREQVESALVRRRAKLLPHTGTETVVGESSSTTPQTLLLGPLSRERLKLLQVHSTGGTGRVWRAYDIALQREVALKELLPQYARSPMHRERFHREACVAAQLAHPGTAPVHEYREEEGRCYYTMKFLAGRTLAEVIRQTHRAIENDSADPFARHFELLTYFVSVCDTIAYAHSQGVIHRDLKGDNVLVGEFGEVTVIDWGLAKLFSSTSEAPSKDPALSDSATLQGERLGTPAYMAPEQARGAIDQIDTRTDVYGLAALLYEILTGKPPFTGDTVNQVMHKVEAESPVPPRKLQPLTPRSLEAICLKGLRKRREDRQQSATELRDGVRHWMTHQTDRRREAESRALFFSLSQDLFVTVDSIGRFTHTNPAFEKLLCYGPGAVLGRHYEELLHPDDLTRSRRVFLAVLAGASEPDFVSRLRGEDGVYRPISWTISKSPSDVSVYAVGRPLDASSERRREARQRETFFSLSRDLFVSLDERGNVTHTNAAYNTFFGYDPRKSTGRSYQTKLHADDIALVSKKLASVQAGGAEEDFVARVQRSDGDYCPISWTLTKIPGETATYAIGRPLDAKSQRRRAAELRAQFFSLSQDLFVISDEHGKAAQINEAWQRVLGWLPEDVIGKPYTDFVVAEDVAPAARAGRKALVKGSVVDIETGMRCRDGSVRQIVWTLSRVPTETVVYCVGRDVTQRRRTEQRIEALFRKSPEPLLVVDTLGRIERTNERVDELFGYEPGELTGQPLEVLLPEWYRAEHHRYFQAYLAEPVVRSMGRNIPLPSVTKQGVEKRFSISLSPLRLDDELLVIAALLLE